MSPTKAGAAIAAFVLLSSGFACKKSMEIRARGGCQVQEKPGWVDDHTFELTASGAPGAASEKLLRRRTEAEDAAIICAQKHVIGMLTGEESEINATVKGGAVVAKSFDDQQNCQIRFRIHRRGLKRLLRQ